MEKVLKTYNLSIDETLEVKNGVNIHGTGKFYFGQVDSHDKAAGFGRYINSNGEFFDEGHRKNNQLCGYGRTVYQDGKVKEGKWEYGQFKGNMN